MEIEGDQQPLGTLDLNDNGLIVDYVPTEPSPLSLHRNQILQARNENFPLLWTGHGITSSAAATQARQWELAVDEALSVFGEQGGEFLGVPIDPGNEALLIHLRALPTAEDIDRLTAAIRAHDVSQDLTGDGAIDLADLTFLVKSRLHTFFGDADLNGEFNSADFVQVFAAGKYETPAAAGWGEGDWNGDGLFSSADFVIAFSDGGYEQGPVPATAIGAAANPLLREVSATGRATFTQQLVPKRILVPCAKTRAIHRRRGNCRSASASHAG